MELVKQSHKRTCAVACLSMLTGIPYKTILKEIPKVYRWGMNCQEVSKFLVDHGYQVGWWNAPPFIDNGFPYIVRLRCYHMVVFYNEMMYDPLNDGPVETPIYSEIFYGAEVKPIERT